MRESDRIRRQSRRIALCGLLAALTTALLALGSLIPLAAVACPMLAMVCLLPVVLLYGPGAALLVYAGAALLALLLCADKEPALLYVFLGWYPALRPRLSRLPRLFRVPVKCALFSLAVSAMYALALHLFRMEAIVEEFAGYSTAMTLGLLALGNVVFLLFDRCLGTLSPLLRAKLLK